MSQGKNSRKPRAQQALHGLLRSRRPIWCRIKQPLALAPFGVGLDRRLVAPGRRPASTVASSGCATIDPMLSSSRTWRTNPAWRC